MTTDLDALWSDLIEERDGWRELHVNCHFADEVDVAALFATPELDALEDLWLEHWLETVTFRDDYRPWIDALAQRPLPKLRSLTFGGYSDRSIHAQLGTAAGLGATLQTLERLVLVGDGTRLEPIRAPQLRELWLELGDFPAPVARRMLRESELPSLVALKIRLFDSAMEDEGLSTYARIAPLFERSDLRLEQLRLSGLAFERDDLEAMLGSPVTSTLKVLDLHGGCTVDGGASTIVRSRDRLANVLVVPPKGVTSDELAAAGIDACPRHEAVKRIPVLVPSRW